MMVDVLERLGAVRPRLGVVITMWSQERGADYAAI